MVLIRWVAILICVVKTCVSNNNVEYVSPYFSLFNFVGHQPPNMENHYFLYSKKGGGG